MPENLKASVDDRREPMFKALWAYVQGIRARYTNKGVDQAFFKDVTMGGQNSHVGINLTAVAGSVGNIKQ